MKHLVALSVLLASAVSASAYTRQDHKDVVSFSMSVAISGAVEQCTTLYPEFEKLFDSLLTTWESSNAQSIERGRTVLEQKAQGGDFDYAKYMSDKAKEMVASLENEVLEDQKLGCASVMEGLIGGS
jgi:hypothetical protein